MERAARVLGESLEKCCTPFASDEPWGADPRLSEDFAALRAEVQKLTAMSSADGAVDWKKIRQLGVDLLGSRTKDLTVAGYLTLALFYLDGYLGLADGVAILRRFVEDGWEHVHPQRPRARVNAFAWLVERATPFVGEREVSDAEATVLPEIRSDLQAIQEAVRERLAEQAPSFAELIGGLAKEIQRHPAPEPEPAEASPESEGDEAAKGEGQPSAGPAAATPATPAAPRPSGAPAAAAAPPPEGATSGDLRDGVRVLVAPLRQAAPTSPLPYRLLRALKWDDINAAPAADASGKTKVPPPRPQQRAALEGLFNAGNWPDLLEASEGAFQAGPGTFWLDLHRYTVTALENQGGPRAAAAVREELAGLLERLKTLPRLTFSDDSPYAGDETRLWIDTAVRPADLPTSGVGGGGEGSALEAEEMEKVRSLLSEKKRGEALDILQRALDRASSRRGKFLTRLAVGRAFLQAQQLPWAQSLLEELQREMEGMTLEGWEPAVVAETCQLLALCYARTLRQAPEAEQEVLRGRIEALRPRLVRLDLKAVAAIEEALAE
jgi:type VI secretion system protein VasJ